MKSIWQVIILMFCLGFYSCGPTQREKATNRLEEAKISVTNGDTLKAIELLKTIPLQFPKAKVQVGVSKNLTDELYFKLTDNRRTQIISLEKSISFLEKNFLKEKTEFDSFVQYVPTRMSINKSWNKSFLQVNLDERGEIFLTSHYMGKEWLQHTSIRVYDEEIQAKTLEVPLNDPNNRRSDFLEYKWEKVAYTNGKSDEVIKFIVDNIDRDLKCVYIGDNQYYIILEDFNKEAIRDAYRLSQAIKRKSELTKELKELDSASKRLE